MKYTIRQHYRRLQGQCLRCGMSRKKVLNPKRVRIFVTCDLPWVRHTWKMR